MPGLCRGSTRESSGVAQVQRRDHLGFTPGSANRVPSRWRSWKDTGCPIALVCPNLPLGPPFSSPPIGRLKRGAGNDLATALLLPGTYAVSCWKARMSQGDSQTYFRPFFSLNVCARQLHCEQQGPSKATHTNVLYFEKVYSFNGDSFNWVLPSLGAIKWHLLALDWKATVHAAPSYPAPAALLCITASHSDLTNLIHA